ncbi:MAG: glycosyltransferase family 4 protein [Pseudomonadota bacterium]|nr:glycosyltransferase family 4 protein [Pseudomonadota bacterium]
MSALCVAGAMDDVRIAAFTKYDREAASTRQRVLQYLPALSEAGIHVDYHPLLGDDYVRGLATGRKSSKAAIARAYWRRMTHLLRGPDYDAIWIYAELFPYLPAAFERLAFSRGKPVVYDTDDAFFLAYDDHRNAWVRRLLGGKLDALMAGAAACCCGNPYLRDHAARCCRRSIVLPTVVDTDIYAPSPARGETRPLVIGWIGSPSTWPNVRPLLPLLGRLCRAHDLRFRAVGAGVGAERDRFDGLDLVEWSEAAEVAEVQAMDIGIMPLDDLPFQRGKSGYKLVQYMACGLPVIASPVGVNCQIVVNGVTGHLATSEAEWNEALSRLIGDPALRARMGQAGRASAVENYSLSSQAPRLVELFRSVVMTHDR